MDPYGGRLYQIYKESCAAGGRPRILLLIPARHYRRLPVAGKGVDTDTPGISYPQLKTILN